MNKSHKIWFKHEGDITKASDLTLGAIIFLWKICDRIGPRVCGGSEVNQIVLGNLPTIVWGLFAQWIHAEIC